MADWLIQIARRNHQDKSSEGEVSKSVMIGQRTVGQCPSGRTPDSKSTSARGLAAFSELAEHVRRGFPAILARFRDGGEFACRFLVVTAVLDRRLVGLDRFFRRIGSNGRLESFQLRRNRQLARATDLDLSGITDV